MLPGSAPRLLDGLLDPTLRDPEFHVMSGGTIAVAGLLALLLVLVDGLSAPLASHLFYLPVMLGALVYGWRGGVTVALVAGLLAAVIASGVAPAPVASPVAGLLPVAVQIVLGFALGGLADAVREHLRRALLEAPGPVPMKGRPGQAGGVVGGQTPQAKRERAFRRRGTQRRCPRPRLDISDNALLADLQRALKDDHGLHLVFQPKVDLRNGRCTGAEALIRWSCDGRGAVPPGRFVPLAEDTHLIRPLTEWVLRQGLDQLRDWQRGGLDLTLAVNISVRNLMQPDFVFFVGQELAMRGLPPHLLHLEVTESGLMVDPHASIATLQALKALGVHIAIDDFGTGQSSMAYLRHLPADTVKIDRSFVDDMHVDRSDEVIVRATIMMARFLRLRVVAEGVENGQIYEKLRRFRCDEVQGYHIAKPMAGSDLADWIAAPAPWREAV
ncbi:EAL domain-containing protein [Marinibaculum pumilum]|uniref:EAL domain-containing protein n=1 Tax=Marinibaculum pumilum TaxID=1766165 RepID=A0ABV7KVB7_9PROT